MLEWIEPLKELRLRLIYPFYSRRSQSTRKGSYWINTESGAKLATLPKSTYSIRHNVGCWPSVDAYDPDTSMRCGHHEEADTVGLTYRDALIEVVVSGWGMVQL
ncbi:hypothetical protein K449DRAFT_437602 [Hypoxylon sp. EC38]|nr:hypothetical protein K449DRAFT_437602 [Hypoxylon sp. EC38]